MPKAELRYVMMSLLIDLRATCDVNVKYVCFAHAGENEAFEWFCKQEWMGVKFEYTVPHTPQQNGRMERKLAIPFDGVHAMSIIMGVKWSMG